MQTLHICNPFGKKARSLLEASKSTKSSEISLDKGLHPLIEHTIKLIILSSTARDDDVLMIDDSTETKYTHFKQECRQINEINND